MKVVTEARGNNMPPIRAYLNPSAVLWIQEARSDQRGKTRVALARVDEHDKSIFLEEPLPVIRDRIAPSAVCFERAEECVDNKRSVYVVMDRVRRIYPVRGSFEIEFIDGSRFLVNDIDNVLGSLAAT